MIAAAITAIRTATIIRRTATAAIATLIHARSFATMSATAILTAPDITERATGGTEDRAIRTAATAAIRTVGTDPADTAATDIPATAMAVIRVTVTPAT